MTGYLSLYQIITKTVKIDFKFDKASLSGKSIKVVNFSFRVIYYTIVKYILRENSNFGT